MQGHRIEARLGGCMVASIPLVLSNYLCSCAAGFYVLLTADTLQHCQCHNSDTSVSLVSCQGIMAPDRLLEMQACPCTNEAVCRMDNINAFNQNGCGWNGHRPGSWYFIHGGMYLIMIMCMIKLHCMSPNLAQQPKLAVLHVLSAS